MAVRPKKEEKAQKIKTGAAGLKEMEKRAAIETQNRNEHLYNMATDENYRTTTLRKRQVAETSYNNELNRRKAQKERRKQRQESVASQVQEWARKVRSSASAEDYAALAEQGNELAASIADSKDSLNANTLNIAREILQRGQKELEYRQKTGSSVANKSSAWAQQYAGVKSTQPDYNQMYKNSLPSTKQARQIAGDLSTESGRREQQQGRQYNGSQQATTATNGAGFGLYNPALEVVVRNAQQGTRGAGYGLYSDAIKNQQIEDTVTRARASQGSERGSGFGLYNSALDSANIQRTQKVSDNRNKADFAQNSTYDESINDKLYKTINAGKKIFNEDTEGLNTLMMVSNLVPEAPLISQTTSPVSEYLDTVRYASLLTDDEIQNYNYLYKTEGQQAANDYWDSLQSTLTARYRGDTEKRMSDFADDNPVLSSAVSVAIKPLEDLSYISDGITKLGGGTIDENDPSHSINYGVSSIRDTVSGNINSDVGRFFYRTGMSMADFAYSLLITGGWGAVVKGVKAGASALKAGKGVAAAGNAVSSSTKAAKTAQNVSLAIMGTEAAAETVQDAKDRGLTDAQAMTLGTISGLAEVATEKISIDVLLDKVPALGKNLPAYIAKNVLAEGSEEGVSDTVNLFADILISKDKSEWETSIRAYKEAGYSESEAFGKAVGDQAVSVLLDMAGGGLSGGIFAGATGGLHAMQTHNASMDMASDVGALQEAIETGLESSKDSRSYKMASKLQAKVNNGETVTQRETAALISQNIKQLNYESELEEAADDKERRKQGYTKTQWQNKKAIENALNSAREQNTVKDIDAGTQITPANIDAPATIQEQVAEAQAAETQTPTIYNGDKSAEKVQQDRQLVSSIADNFRAAGSTDAATVMEAMYSDTLDAIPYAEGMQEAYDAGYENIEVPDIQYMSEAAVQAMYKAGKAARTRTTKATTAAVQAESATPATTAQETTPVASNKTKQSVKQTQTTATTPTTQTEATPDDGWWSMWTEPQTAESGSVEAPIATTALATTGITTPTTTGGKTGTVTQAVETETNSAQETAPAAPQSTQAGETDTIQTTTPAEVVSQSPSVLESTGATASEQAEWKQEIRDNINYDKAKAGIDKDGFILFQLSSQGVMKVGKTGVEFKFPELKNNKSATPEDYAAKYEMETGEKCIAVTSEAELNELYGLDPEETEPTAEQPTAEVTEPEETMEPAETAEQPEETTPVPAETTDTTTEVSSEKAKTKKDKKAEQADIKNMTDEEMDAEYLHLAKAPKKNKKRLDALVREAAIRNGYDSPMLYHGTSSFGFTKIDTSLSDDHISFFATSNPDVAQTYAGTNAIKDIADAEKIKKIDKKNYLYGDTKKITGLLQEETGQEWTFIETEEDLMDVLNPDDEDAIDLYSNIFRDAFNQDTANAKRGLYATNYVTGGTETEFYTPQRIKEMLTEGRTSGIYRFYAKTQGLTDVKNETEEPGIWSKLRYEGEVFSTRELAKKLKREGSSGFIARNIYDRAAAGFKKAGSADIYCFFYGNDVKSADTVTYDDSGKIIPLSKRFDDSKQDLRYKKTEGTKNKNALDGYDQKLINNWKNSKRIEIYTDEASMKKFIKDAMSNKNLGKKMYFGKVPPNLASRIEAETGIDVEGYNCSISAYEINKLYYDHGNEENEAQRGQRAIDENDIINIPEILTEADDIRLSKKKYDEKPAIEFEKKRGNERTTVVAVVSNKHIDLRVQTLWVNKKRSIATPISEQADINTPKATRGTAPTSNVTHGAENSNQAFIKNKNAIGSGTPNLAEWTTTTTKGNTAEVKSLSEIIAKARHELGFNYTIGHIQGKNVLGQFNRRDKGVRTKKANDLLTFIHEAGHSIDERYKITRNPKEIPQGAKDELDSLLSQDVKAQYPQSHWLAEGMAEYIKEYLRNKDIAIAKYPEFTKHLMSKLNEADQDMLFTFADEVNAYLSKGHETATDAIRFQGETYDFRTPKEKFTDKNDEFRMKWVDSMQGVKRFTRASQDNKAYIMAINSAYSDNRAGDIIFHELRTPDGRYVAPGFRSCFEGINTGNKEEMRLFNEYLVVMHGPERLTLGKAVFADDVQNTKEWMINRQQELEAEHPEFKGAAEKVWAFVDEYTKTYAVDTGLLKPETYKKWKQAYKMYVPFQRVMDDKGLKPVGARRGFANQTSPYKRAKGSGRDIYDPVTSIIDMVIKTTNTAIRNSVFQEITRAAHHYGVSAELLEAIPQESNAHRIYMAAYKQQIKDAAQERNLDANGRTILDEALTAVDDVVFQYDVGRPHDNIVTVMENGEPQFYKVNDPLLLESIANFTPPQMEGILATYAKISRFITSNLTGANILWSFFSNAPRDFMTFLTFFNDKKHLLEAVAAIPRAYTNTFKEYWGKGQVNPIYREYMGMGGGDTTVYTADISGKEKIVKKFNQTTARRILKNLNLINLVEWVANMIEKGPRFATYYTLRTHGMSAEEAFYEAMDVTTNFRRSGTMGKKVNGVAIFFNAGVQGVDKFARWISAEDIRNTKYRKKGARNRTIMFMAASAALAGIFYAINNGTDEDKENYQALSAYTKNNFWVIPLGDGQYFTVPKPRELAVAESFFESVLERTEGGNTHAFDDFYEYFTDNFLPPVASEIAQLPSGVIKDGLDEGLSNTISDVLGDFGLIGVASNVVSNRDFLGRPIESTSLQNVLPKDRYTNSTSIMAKTIGEVTGYSPQKADYWGKNLLGSWWKIPTALFPVGESERDITLGIKNSYVKDNLYSTDRVNWMYEVSDKLTMESNSDEENKEKKIAAAEASNISSFYGKFNKLNKDNDSTEIKRATRKAVLDMVYEYQKYYENGKRDAAQTKLYESIPDAGSVKSYMPDVMSTTIQGYSGTEKVSYQLNDQQYYEYQTIYNSYYWAAVSKASSIDAEKIATIKKDANNTATNDMLKLFGTGITVTKKKKSK